MAKKSKIYMNKSKKLQKNSKIQTNKRKIYFEEDLSKKEQQYIKEKLQKNELFIRYIQSLKEIKTLFTERSLMNSFLY